MQECPRAAFASGPFTGKKRLTARLAHKGTGLSIFMNRDQPEKKMRRAVVGVITFVTMGCYTATPLLTTPSPGQEVVVQVTDAGSTQLAQYVGPRVSVLNGHFAGATGDSLALSVTSTETRTGDIRFWTGEPVTIPNSMVATVSAKTISPWRSALAVGAIVVAALTIKLGFDGISSTSRTQPPPVGQ